MKFKYLALLSLFASTSLFADYYDQSRYSSCPGGNCPYQRGGADQRYYPEASGQAYYRSNPDYNRDQRNYRGQYDRDGYYGHGQYARDEYDDRTMNRGQYSRDGYGDRDMNRARDGYYKDMNRGRDGSYDRDMNRGQYDSRDRYYDDRSNRRELSDEEITKEVRDAVGPGWMSSGYPNVTFDVSNGTVNLRGSVKTMDEKRKIEDSIRKIDGVRQVNNQLVVEEAKTAYNYRDDANADTRMMRNNETGSAQDSGATDSDRIINQKLRDNLSGWFTKGFETVTFHTQNGTITVIGFVENPDDLEKINKEARKIDGVRAVNINATIQRR